MLKLVEIIKHVYDHSEVDFEDMMKERDNDEVHNSVNNDDNDDTSYITIKM